MLIEAREKIPSILMDGNLAAVKQLVFDLGFPVCVMLLLERIELWRRGSINLWLTQHLPGKMRLHVFVQHTLDAFRASELPGKELLRALHAVRIITNAYAPQGPKTLRMHMHDICHSGRDKHERYLDLCCTVRQLLKMGVSLKKITSLQIHGPAWAKFLQCIEVDVRWAQRTLRENKNVKTIRLRVLSHDAEPLAEALGCEPSEITASYDKPAVCDDYAGADDFGERDADDTGEQAGADGFGERDADDTGEQTGADDSGEQAGADDFGERDADDTGERDSDGFDDFDYFEAERILALCDDE